MFFFIAASIILFNCSNKQNNNGIGMNVLEKENLFAWCIIPYDSLDRTPTERAEMLLELGISSYAYDWRSEHLPIMEEELRIMKEKKIKLKGIWFWLQGSNNSYFDENNELIISTLKKLNISTDIWIGIPEDYFESFDDLQKIDKAVEIICYTYKRAKEIGCTISLYNHGGWFGNPKNQINIIEKLGYNDIGIIYNFHHAHDQIDEYQENIVLMKKYLRAVNINGMKINGPKILPVGDGDTEQQMIQDLISIDYNGPIGILGHVENVDVKEILMKNLIGLEKIKNKLKYTFDYN